MTMLILIIAALSILVIGSTYLIHRLVGKRKYLKYTPAVIFLILGIYNVYMIKTNPGEGFQDIAKALYLISNIVCSISGLGTAVFIDFVLPKVKKQS